MVVRGQEEESCGDGIALDLCCRDGPTDLQNLTKLNGTKYTHPKHAQVNASKLGQSE